jgi:hypothetical protein
MALAVVVNLPMVLVVADVEDRVRERRRRLPSRLAGLRVVEIRRPGSAGAVCPGVLVEQNMV